MPYNPGKSALFSPNRRQLIVGAAAGATMLSAPSILRAQTKTLVVANGGGAVEGALRTAFFEPFEKETGVKVIGASYMDAARIKAMVDSDAVNVDVLHIDPVEAAAVSRMGLVEPIDTSIVDVSPLDDWAAKDGYIIIDVAGTVMGWNTASYNNDTRPRDWVGFFDTEAYPGQRGLYKFAQGTLELAALGAGIKPEELYPLDLDAAFGMLDKIRDSVTWWSSGAQSAQLLISNEVDLGMSWNGRLQSPKDSGAPIDFSFDQTVYTGDGFVIPKGAKDKELSMRFMASLVSPERQAGFAQNIPYGPSNPAALELLEPEVLDVLPNSPQNSKTAVRMDMEYWAENGDAIFSRFNEWVI